MSQSFEILGLDHLFLCPKAWGKAMSFWRDTLGMEVASDWSTGQYKGAALKLGDAHVIVAEGEKIRDEELGFPIEHGKPYIYVKVKGLDALVAHLKAHHIPIVGGPVQLHWGPRMVSVRDPEGMEVMFVEWEKNDP